MVARTAGVVSIVVAVCLLGSASAASDPGEWTYNKANQTAEEHGIPFYETYHDARDDLIEVGDMVDNITYEAVGTVTDLLPGQTSVEYSVAAVIEEHTPDMRDDVPEDPGDIIPDRQETTDPYAGIGQDLLGLHGGQEAGQDVPLSHDGGFEGDADALDTDGLPFGPGTGGGTLPVPRMTPPAATATAPSPAMGTMGGFIGSTLAGDGGWLETMASGFAGVLLLSAAALAARFAWVSLFSRFDQNTVLEHPQRQRLHDLIRSRPGIRLHEAAETLEMDASLVRHHLRLMEQQGAIVTMEWQRGKHLFENHGRYRQEERIALAAMQRPLMRKIVKTLLGTPGLSQRDLSHAVDASPSLVHWHVTRLLEAGLVRKERKGRAMLHLPTESASTYVRA